MTEIIDWSFAHLLLMYDIEIVRCKGLSETCEYLHTMTRSLESQLERPLTAFNCVNKAMRQKAGDELAGAQKEKFMVRSLLVVKCSHLIHSHMLSQILVESDLDGNDANDSKYE